MRKSRELSIANRRWALMLTAPLLALAPMALFGGSASAHGGVYHCTRTVPAEGHLDTDADGLCDDEETVAGTNPNVRDTDNDDAWDGLEVAFERTNPLNPDTDSDGLTDGSEIHVYGTNPRNGDTDADGLGDGHEVNTHGTDPGDPDTDGDLFSDKTEVNNGSDPRNPLSVPFKGTNVEAPVDSPFEELPVTDTLAPRF